MRISVIIPVYNDDEGLRKTLKALSLQTIAKENIELIIVNDGGALGIDSILKEAIFAPLNTKIVNRVENKGAYFSRNEGIAIAENELIAFTDAGCTPKENWLESGLIYLKEYDYVAGKVEIDENLVINLANYHDYLTAFPVKDYFKDYGFGVTANIFLKKKVIEAVGPFQNDLYSGGDMEFGIRLNRYSNIKKAYAASCIVYHPPRSHREKVAKLKRVWKGQRQLLLSYPEDFRFLKQPLIKKIRQFLPPSLKAFNRVYLKSKEYSPLSFYLYMYKFRIVKGLIS